MSLDEKLDEVMDALANDLVVDLNASFASHREGIKDVLREKLDEISDLATKAKQLKEAQDIVRAVEPATPSDSDIWRRVRAVLMRDAE